MDWSYIAGFFDGEGTFGVVGKTDYRATLTQAHEGVLKKIKEFTGFGNIWKAKRRKSHWKESWIYTIARQEDVLVFLRKVYPHLIVKKEKAKKIIPIVAKIVSNSRKKRARLQRKIEACKLLRRKGLSYRAIGKKLKIDHGYVRRMVIYK